jgi:hypothetical protein
MALTILNVTQKPHMDEAKALAIYTERDSKIGFGLTRKLSRFDDRKLPNIRNMGAIYDHRISRLWLDPYTDF